MGERASQCKKRKLFRLCRCVFVWVCQVSVHRRWKISILLENTVSIESDESEPQFGQKYLISFDFQVCGMALSVYCVYHRDLQRSQWIEYLRTLSVMLNCTIRVKLLYWTCRFIHTITECVSESVFSLCILPFQPNLINSNWIRLNNAVRKLHCQIYV